jgi:Phosphotransferase enzyme family
MDKDRYFSNAFIQEMMNNHHSTEINVTNIELFDIDNSASILVTLTSQNSDEFIGHFGLKISYTENNLSYSKKMVMKVKPHGRVISDMLAGLSGLCNERLQKEYGIIKDKTGFYYTHDKEIELYKQHKHTFFPVIYGYYINENDNVYALLMEYFEDVEMLNSVMDINLWDKEHIDLGLKALITWHKNNTGKTEWYTTKYSDIRNEEQIKQLQKTWLELLINAHQRFPDLYSEHFTQCLKDGIQEILALWIELEDVPKSVAHNDFNPRNVFFKNDDSNGKNICVYDWELATVHFPVYDLIEFLSFTSSNLNDETIINYFKQFQDELSHDVPLYANNSIFRASLLCSAYDFGLHRLGMYMMAHSVGPYPFIPHVIKNYERILNYALQRA